MYAELWKFIVGRPRVCRFGGREAAVRVAVDGAFDGGISSRQVGSPHRPDAADGLPHHYLSKYGRTCLPQWLLNTGQVVFRITISANM